MNVKKLIDAMANRAFDIPFRQGIHELYDAKDLGDTEPDYQTGFAHLQTILSVEQKEALGRMEDAFTARRDYAAKYSFQCGIYGAFRQLFGTSNAKDGGFDDLVYHDLLTQPKMQRHQKNFAMVELCNGIYTQIMETLSEEDQEHMVSVALLVRGMTIRWFSRPLTSPQMPILALIRCSIATGVSSIPTGLSITNWRKPV